jgi:serine/threonine protein kinase
MSDEATRTIGEFDVVATIGESSVGALYRADHCVMGRRSHIRVLARAYTSDDEAIRLALSEGYSMPYDHPNLGGGCMYIASIARGRVDDTVFFAFSSANELDLETLARERGPLPWSEVRWMMLDICRGLDEAHRHHYVHGDLQAGHCFYLEWDDHQRVRVTGFGLAPARHRALLAGAEPPPWMPPEQVAGAEPDERADVYAAGYLLLHLLLGEPPSPSDRKVPLAYRREALARDYRSELPQWPREVDELLARALAANPDERYPTMRALATAIAAVDGGDVATAMARFDPPKPPELPESPAERREKIKLGLQLGLFALIVIFALIFGK